MKIRYTPEFRRDLRKIKAYLVQNGIKSASTIGSAVMQACSDLKCFPDKGESAAERYGVDTDMLFFITSNRKNKSERPFI